MTDPYQHAPPPPPPPPGPADQVQGFGWATSDGTPPPPGPIFFALYRLILRSVATRGRLLAIVALDAFSLLTAAAVSMASPPDPLRAAAGFVNGNLSTLVPVAVLVFGAAAIGDLIDDGSLVYLWLRPIPARLHVLAAWAATVTITLPLVGVPVLVATAVIHPDGGLFVGAVLGTLVAVAAYSGLFVTAGIRFRRALPWGLAYILIWEGFVASAGKTASKLAVRSYVRSILVHETGIKIKLGTFSLAAGIIVPLVAAAVCLVYASRRLAKTDVA